MPRPPAGTASPSRIARAMPPPGELDASIVAITAGSVAHSTYSSSGRSVAGRRHRPEPSCDLSSKNSGEAVTPVMLPGRGPGPARLFLQPVQPPVLAPRLTLRLLEPLHEQYGEEHHADQVARAP